jgi:hypothetical protein
VAAAYFAYLLEAINRPDKAAARSNYPDGSDQLLMPTYQDYLKSKEDAVYLEACLKRKLLNPPRGLRDGEAVVCGSLFVWEANCTGIDR